MIAFVRDCIRSKKPPVFCSFLDAAAKSGLTSHKYLWLVTQSVGGDPVDVPASIRRSLPLGMIGKVFIYFVIPTQNFKDLCIISHTLLKMHQTQKVRVHLGILCVLRTYLLSYLTLTERSLLSRQLRTRKAKIKANRKKLRHRGHGQRLYDKQAIQNLGQVQDERSIMLCFGAYFNGMMLFFHSKVP